MPQQPLLTLLMEQALWLQVFTGVFVCVCVSDEERERERVSVSVW